MILMLLFLTTQILAMDTKIVEVERKTIEQPWGITIFGEYPWSIVKVKPGPFLYKVANGWTIMSINDIEMNEESEKQLDELFEQETELKIEFDTSKETQTKNLDRHSNTSKMLEEKSTEEFLELLKAGIVEISTVEKIKQRLLQKPEDVEKITSTWNTKIELQYSPSNLDSNNVQDSFKITLDGNRTILFKPKMISYFNPDEHYGETGNFKEKVSFSFDIKTKTFELQGDVSAAIGPLQFKTLKFEKFGLDTPNSVYRSIINTLQVVSN
jgi:hypothetical protein